MVVICDDVSVYEHLEMITITARAKRHYILKEVSKRCIKLRAIFLHAMCIFD
jgi:hypothetical protein